MADAQDAAANPHLRHVVAWVAGLNLGYFGVEFAVALAIGSVSLFADSIDFLEDASVNLLILLGLGWGARSRARLGMVLAFVLLLPAAATLWTAWKQFSAPAAPAPIPLSLAGLGAMLVNGTCALMLARYRTQGGSLTRAAFLSARNDVLANIAIVLAGLVTAYIWNSAWPDLTVGLAIAAMNADAGREVWKSAREEHRAAVLHLPTGKGSSAFVPPAGRLRRCLHIGERGVAGASNKRRSGEQEC